MTSEFVKDAIALIRACRMDSNCPLKNISQDGSVFKFKIQQEELKFDVEIREGQKYPCGTQVTLRTDTGTMTTGFDARLHICAGKVANRLGYTTVPYLNDPPPAGVPTTPKTMTIDDRYIVYLNHPLGTRGIWRCVQRNRHSNKHSDRCKNSSPEAQFAGTGIRASMQVNS